MRKVLFSIIQIILTITIFSACSKNEEELSAPNKVCVYVLFTPEGFCNMGYNDNTLKTIETLSHKYGYKYSFCVPETLEDGMNYYMDWCKAELGNDVARSLFIFASGVYDVYLAEVPHPTADTRKDILMFEVEKELPYAYTFAMSYYGASYMIGSYYLKHMPACFQIIAANVFLEGLEYVYDGLTDATEDMTYGRVNLNYLSNYPDGGLNDDNLAYSECKLELYNNPNENNIFIPFAGSSNLGVYRFSQYNYQVSVGVDCIDPDTYLYTPLCMNKRMDLALDDFLSLWINGDEIPRYTFYTLESGRVVVECCALLATEPEILEELLEQALAKEKEYFQKRKADE